jgi:hypothetical protein
MYEDRLLKVYLSISAAMYMCTSCFTVQALSAREYHLLLPMFVPSSEDICASLEGPARDELYARSTQ